jgi:hypothetical protein
MVKRDVRDEVVYLRAAGLDLGKRFLLACVRVPGEKRAGTWTVETDRFGTTSVEIRRLLGWLRERRVEVVVLEATSDYWRAVYYTLQPHLNLMLESGASERHSRAQERSQRCCVPCSRPRSWCWPPLFPSGRSGSYAT